MARLRRPRQLAGVAVSELIVQGILVDRFRIEDFSLTLFQVETLSSEVIRFGTGPFICEDARVTELNAELAQDSPKAEEHGGREKTGQLHRSLQRLEDFTVREVPHSHCAA